MKRRASIRQLSRLFLFLASMALGLAAQAEKMNLDAHNLVIEKLENSLKMIKNDQTVDGIGLKLQLANLYSEKSRLLLIEEGHQNCQNCLGSKTFRQKAINYYQVVLPKLQGNDHDQVALQLAHLFETTNRSKEALKLYNELINKKTASSKTLAKAYSKRASAFFKEGDFDKAIADFKVVMKMAPEEEQGAIQHKLAWALFNKGEVDAAIAKMFFILNNENLLKQSSEDGYQYSESFHSEVARDLALFMAKDQITQKSLDKLVEVSPPEDVLTNLLFLGDEAERVGQVQGAPLAWERALSIDGFPNHKKLPVLLSIARYHRDQFHLTKANQFYAQAIELAKKNYGSDIKDKSCQDACAEQVKALKQFLVQWEKHANKLAKAKEAQTSKLALMKAYQTYHQFQSDDYETQLWLGQLSHSLDQPVAAQKAYARAADLLMAAEGKNTAANKKLAEGALLQEIKIAEETNNSNQRLMAYNHYLDINPQGAYQAKVRYQRAKIFYDQNQIKEAYQQFDEIVNDANFKDADLKLKSAHLGLDALVLLKDIETLETKSLEYSKRFPKDAAQFHQISRKAGLQIVTTLAKKDQSESSAEKALAKLATVTVQGMDRKELQAHYRMKIDLALKAKKWDLAKQALEQYLALRDISTADRTWALNKKLGLAELLLDFNQAYQTVLKLNYAQSTNPKELLKGALLAELVKANPAPWLELVIKSGKASKQQTNLARAQLVRLSKQPWKALRQHSQFLLSQKTLFADLALECFDRDADFMQVRWALALPGIKSTWAGQTMQRMVTLAQLQNKAESTRQLRLNTRTDALLASSLKLRIKALAEIKETLRLAQRQQDWTLQVIAAALLKNENQRLGDDIEDLPVPKKLSPKEKRAYQLELMAQASPFKQTAAELEQFIAHSWEDTTYVDGLLARIESSDRIRTLLMNELRSLAAFAPKSMVVRMKQKLADLKDRPSKKDLFATQNQLRRDPFDLELQEQLLSMERKLGNQSMVVFLQARGNSIKAGEL